MTIDQDTIIHAAATLFVLCALSFIVALALRIWHQRRPSTRTVVLLGPASITADQEADLSAVLNALDRAVARLEQDETLEWKAQYSAVEDAELVAEQYQARREMEQEG